MAKVVIIDDELGVRDTIRRTLEQMGHTVLDASDGRRGIGLISSEKPDLIITDILMPEQEGLETIRMVRETCASVPIVAISGGGRTARMDFLEVAQEFGADEVLAKPFRPKQLMEVVSRLLSR